MNNICGAITISGAHVTAIRGSGAPYCIGKGAADTQNSTRTCGTITIGGVDKGNNGVNPTSGDEYVYP